MNTISIVALIALPFLLGYALYIDACRRGRDSRGKFTKKSKRVEIETVKKPLFYSELRNI